MLFSIKICGQNPAVVILPIPADGEMLSRAAAAAAGVAVPLIVSHAPHLGAEVGTNAQTHTCAVNMHMPQAYAYTHVHMCTCRRDGPKSLHRNCGIKITNYLFFFLATGMAYESSQARH